MEGIILTHQIAPQDTTTDPITDMDQAVIAMDITMAPAITMAAAMADIMVAEEEDITDAIAVDMVEDALVEEDAEVEVVEVEVVEVEADVVVDDVVAEAVAAEDANLHIIRNYNC